MWNRIDVSVRLRLAVLGLALAACSSSNVLGPNNQPEVNNQTDTFQWQVTAMDNISQTLTYTWQNTGTTANVNQSPGLSSGSASLVIEDASGTEVYSRGFSQSGTFTTDSGLAGAWTIRVALSVTSGALNFRAEKP